MARTGSGGQWLRARACENNQCVEVMFDQSDHVLVRDSKTPDGPVLRFTPAEWRAFTTGIREGDFEFA